MGMDSKDRGSKAKPKPRYQRGPVGRVIVSEERIQELVARLGREITGFYTRRKPVRPVVLLGVMGGAFIFMADLARHLDFELEVDYVRLSSYGCGTRSSGLVDIVTPPAVSFAGREVLILDELVDTGHTLAFLANYCRGQGAAHVATAVLLDKVERREADFQCDFVGQEVENVHLGGYGMDVNSIMRQYPYVFDATDLMG